MNTNVKDPTTQEELGSQLNSAVAAGNMDEVDRLMAVEIPDQPVEEVEEETEDKDDPVVETEDETVPKDETSDDEVVETKDEAASDSAASKPEDTKTEVPDELNALKAELHRLKSDAGRVPHMQRRQQELERELRDLKLSRKVEESTSTTAKPAAELPEALKTRIEKLKEIDPDLAETLEVMAKTSVGAVDNAKTVAAEIVKDFAHQADAKSDEAFIQEQYNLLVSRIPFAQQVFDRPEWQQWKAKLSPGKRAMAESAYAEDVEQAIQAFVHDMRAAQGGATQQHAADENTQVVDTKTSEAVTKVQESRERKLNADTATKTGAAKGTKPKMSEEELFKAEFDRIKKENHFS